MMYACFLAAEARGGRAVGPDVLSAAVAAQKRNAARVVALISPLASATLARMRLHRLYHLSSKCAL